MKRHRFMPIFLFSLSLFLVSFVLGYQLMGRQINKNNFSQLNQGDISMEDELDLEIILEDNVISPNTIIEERINYKACDHVLTKVKEVETDIVNMSRQEYIDYLESNYPNIKLIAFSSSKITLGLTKNHLCENHYVIGEEGGFIAVFKIDEDGERVLQTVFKESPISLLMEIDQQKIIKGITVDSEDELTEVLENFIS